MKNWSERAASSFKNESAFTEALRNTVPFLQSKMEAGSTINEFEDKYDGKVTCLNAFLF